METKTSKKEASRNYETIYISKFDYEISNALFIGNTSVDEGGAIRIYASANFPILTLQGNLTLAHNTFYANNGSVGNCFSYENGVDSILIHHNIFWNNGNIVDISTDIDALANYNSFKFSTLPTFIIDGGQNRFNENPKFLNPTVPMGTDGIYGNEDDGFSLNGFSPAIDAGDPNFEIALGQYDLSGNARIYNDVLDIGAYEFSCFTNILYIDQMASGTIDGLSWQNAYHQLPAAFEQATANGCRVDSILIAKGIYLATNQNDPNQSLQIPPGSKIVGGYNVQGGALLAWDPETYQTLLSGDIGSASTSDNTKRLIDIEHYTDTTFFVGLTLAKGVDSIGSAIYLPNKPGNAPVIVNIRFTLKQK